MTLALSPSPKLQFFANNGVPLAGGYLYTSAAGAPSTPKTSYSDAAETPNTNPVVLDSAGRCSLWLDGYYYMELWTGEKNTEGSTLLWTQDNVSAIPLFTALQDSGAAAPTTGTWARGWIRWNSAPALGGNVGWVCTTAGTPGIWAEFGFVSANPA